MSDRVTVVTNGVSDLGRSISILCAREGSSVVIADDEPDRAGEVIELIESAGGAATYVAVDLADEDAVQTVIGDAIMTYGALHHVVSCTTSDPVLCSEDIDTEAWDGSMDRSVRAAWLVSKHAGPFLRRSRDTSIVHVVQDSGHPGRPAGFVTAACRGAIGAMTRAMASRLGPDGVRVNSIVAGCLQTPRWERELEASDDPRAELERIMAVHPLGRLGKPEEIAEAVVFMLSSAASFVTGACLVVDGGRSCSGLA